MISQLAKKVRCDDVLKHFSKRKMTFFTFTTKDVVTYSEIRQRWRRLRHFLVEKYRSKDLKYVMQSEARQVEKTITQTANIPTI